MPSCRLLVFELAQQVLRPVLPRLAGDGRERIEPILRLGRIEIGRNLGRGHLNVHGRFSLGVLCLDRRAKGLAQRSGGVVCNKLMGPHGDVMPDRRGRIVSPPAGATVRRHRCGV